MAKFSKADQADAIAFLRDHLVPGNKVWCIVTHVSRSGMSRRIKLLIKDKEGDLFNISGFAARALGWTLNRDELALVVPGCGMDMCFHSVYSLGHALFSRDDPRLQDPANRCGPAGDPGYALRAETL